MFWKNTSGRLNIAPLTPALRILPPSKGAVTSPTTLAAIPVIRFTAPKTGRVSTRSSVKNRKAESREFRW